MTPPPEDEATVVIRGDVVDVAAIQHAIRARVQLRAAAGTPVSADEVDELEARRLARLDDWNFPRETWAAMWPPNLQPWNLDEDYPIRSHRAGVGGPLVAAKRALRSLLRVALRPLVAQQTEVNRALSLMARALAGELAETRLHLRAVERRVARVGALLRELRGEAVPLVRFADDGDDERATPRP